MTVESNETQEVEVVSPQEDNALVDGVESQEVQEKPVNSGPSAEEQAKNWKRMRESKESAERRNTELERQNLEYVNLVKDFVSGKKEEPEEIIDELDIPTFGQTKKVARQEAETTSEKMIKKVLAEEREKNAPNLLKDRFADFDDVVTTENVNYLFENEPELAEPLKNTKELYKRGVLAYKYIKKLGIAKKDSVSEMKKDSSNNSAKPVSPNAISGRNSVGDANVFSRGLTPDLKKKLRQEMSEAIKRR